MTETPPPARRSLPLLVGVLAGATVLVALGVAWPVLLRSADLDPEAEWIWAPFARIDGRPLAFVAVRELELTEAPARATLRIQADEGYVLRLNGVRVGAGEMAEGRAAHAYSVGDLLHAGSNRILVELRSSRGVGAFFLSLVEGDDGRVLVRSDGDWWIFWQYRRALDDLEHPIDRGAQPHVWGRPPVGRWIGPSRAEERPRFDELMIGGPRKADALRSWDGERWQRRSPRRARGVGSFVRFAWNEPVTGYLALPSRLDEAPPALVYFGLSAPPDPVPEAPGTVRIQMPGRRYWTDTRPRTFRHVLIVGPARLAGAEVLEVGRSPLPLPLGGLGPGPGVLGLEPPRLRTTVEDEVWSDLESLEGESRGEAD